MTKVYFSKKIEKILENIDFSVLGEKVAIKLHFGEKGCNTFISPELVRKVYEKVESFGKKATLVECNVLYKGSRTDRISHIETAREHGFIGMDIDILDGERGEEFIEVDGCKLGAGLKKYNSLIVLSHFKGHIAAGFGGAIKNIGMGLGSRAGKLHMHSNLVPEVNREKCIGCGVCVEHCNANAISIDEGKTEISKSKCEGCAMCIAVCPQGAINIPFVLGSSDQLQEIVAKYSKAVLSLFKKVIFINVLENITEHCDCMGIHQEPMMKNVGILYSLDIVAIEKASLDLVNKYSNGKFDRINQIDRKKQIEYAKESGLGDDGYEIEEI